MSESVLHATCVSYFRATYPNMLLWNSLSGINLSNTKDRHQEITKLKREGWIKGIPDIYIALPNGESLHVEFKTDSKNSKQSLEQIEMENKLVSLGHRYEIVRNFREFVSLMESVSISTKPMLESNPQTKC